MPEQQSNPGTDGQDVSMAFTDVLRPMCRCPACKQKKKGCLGVRRLKLLLLSVLVA